MKAALIGLSLVLWMFSGVPAGSAERPPQVGILSPLPSAAVSSPPFEAFRAGLRELGYDEGRNIRLVYRWADGSGERLAGFASELVRLKVDVLLTAPGTLTALAALKATATIPIIFVGVGDAVGLGIVEHLAHPGGNATGLVNESQDSAGKQLEILTEALPRLSRVGVLWRPSNPSYKDLIHRFDDVVRARAVQVVLLAAETPEDLVSAFQTVKRRRIQGLVVQADELFIREGRRIVDLAAASRVPAIYRLGDQAALGGLMAFGPRIPDMYRRAASYVDKVLRGAKPADLPVEQPTRFELVINLKTAKALGITFPPSIRVRADQVIQ
ncbi:MAG TPA: ABC transporter substrate-binding protein [Candidatus Sulfotelmatobacter sp.]|nr:ABC transporter substrate-binding protein [Candidatus Sulfotelmatobacter sp.]